MTIYMSHGIKPGIGKSSAHVLALAALRARVKNGSRRASAGKRRAAK